MEPNARLHLERDLLFAEALAPDLKDYLLSSILYWQLSASHRNEPPLPKGTLGGLLIRLHRLAALEEALDAGQQERLANARRLAETSLEYWSAQAESKALAEIRSRLNIWEAYLADLEARPAASGAEYPTQAEGRTILSLLLNFAHRAEAAAGFAPHLDEADARLREMARPGGFVWNAALAPAFPQERFWWLYVTLRPEAQP
jgi:hypothetical protein